jgi:hypothetical protein
MGIKLDNKFNRRYGGKIKVAYAGKRESPARRRERNAEIAKAFEKVLAGIYDTVVKTDETPKQ